jgi:hypothetical protein
VDESFGVLAVVHGSDAGDETENGGEAGAGGTGCVGRRNNSIDDVVHGVVYPPVGMAAGGNVWRASELGGQAGLAVDGGAYGSGAFLAERFAAVLAKGNSFTIGMVGAVHTSCPSCTRREVVPGLTPGSRVARGCVRYEEWDEAGLRILASATT